MHSNSGKSFFGLMITGGLLACLAGGLYFAYYALMPAKVGLDRPEDNIIILVKKGQSGREIATFLASKNIVSSGRKFLMIGKFLGKENSIRVGEYQVSPTMTPMKIWSVITSGVSLSHPITVREGENMYEIADDIESKGLGTKKEFLQLCKSRVLMQKLDFKEPYPVSLEGYLFPETYFFNRSMSAEEMIKQMVKKFQSVWTPELAKRAEDMRLTKHQVVTLASIVEKETGAPSERPLISSVFHNRLNKKMRLQSDPTTIYGIWEQYKGNLHRKDLHTPTPFNTYTVAALPLGPISNPGREAIRAALFPAQSDFLYFVSHNDGTHQFSKTFAEHNNAVIKFQKDPNARKGKSWRDLKKNKSQAPASKRRQSS
ncbi:endolytic transglycosylase MltG [bacterium]|nr:endolytic transglycosylase MltG [bacterium]